MNRGVHQSSPVQQIMRGNSGWWNNMGPPPAQITPFLPPPSSSGTPVHPQCQQQSAWQENQEHLPESWSQLLLGGLVGEEERHGLGTFHSKKMEAWEEQLLYHSMAGGQIVDVKLEPSATRFAFGHGDEEIAALRSASAWGQVLPASSPNSCITSLSTNMLDFSTNSKSEGKRQHTVDSSEGNRAGNGAVAAKKARVLPSAGSSHTTSKVRKEKLGDRITALHQLVSPFGKTDTASVLLEAIGYIRFLQGQIEALCSPYLGNGSGNTRRPPPPPPQPSPQQPQPPPPLLNDASSKRRTGTVEKLVVEGQEGPKRDLRSRGLCLVPVSCTLHVGNDNGADYWAPSLGGGFR